MNADVHRKAFQDELAALEQRTLDGLDMVLGQLDRALDALQRHDRELAKAVIADDRDVHVHCLDVHQDVLLLVAVHASVLGDLRLVGALLHLLKDIERIGDQCVKVAKLIPMRAGREPVVGAQMRSKLVEIGETVRIGVVQSRRAFAERNVALAQSVVDRHRDVNRLKRDIVLLGVEGGDEADSGEWATTMVLVALALERICDYTLEIGEQTVYVVSGLFREFSSTVGLDRH